MSLGMPRKILSSFTEWKPILSVPPAFRPFDQILGGSQRIHSRHGGMKMELHPLFRGVILPLGYIETTGLNKTKDTIIEIGAAILRDGQVCETFNTFVDPKTGSACTPPWRRHRLPCDD